MAFRWFKRHEKKFLFFICIVIVPTFGISYGVFSYFSRPKGAQAAASFELVRGATTSMSLEDLQDDSRRTKLNRTVDLVARRALLEEAELAGIKVSDAELRDSLGEQLRMMFPNGYTLQDYKNVLARNGWTVTDFEEMVRQDLVVSRLVGLKSSKYRFLSPILYREYSLANTRYELEAVAFRAEDFKAEFSIFDLDPKEVEGFYEGIQASPGRYAWCLENYRIPVSYTLDVVKLAFADVDPETHADLLGIETPPTDDELVRYYENHRGWFVRDTEDDDETDESDADESDAGESDAGESDSDESDADDSDDDDAQDDAPERIPFDEVKEEIRTRVILERAFDELLREIRTGAEEGPPVPLEDASRERSLDYRKIERIPLIDLFDDEFVGHSAIGEEIEGLTDGDLCRVVGDRREDGVYLFRLVSIHPEEYRVLNEVEASLRDDMVTEKARTRMQEVSREFSDEVRKEFEAMIRAEKAAESEDAESTDPPGEEGEPGEETEGSDEDENPETPETPEPPTQEEQMAQAELMALRYRMVEVFDRLVEEKEMPILEIGPTRILDPMTEEYEAADEATRFLLGSQSSRLVASLDQGQVSAGGLVDRQEWVAYVVALVKKEVPTAAEMTAEDYDSFRARKLFRERELDQMRQSGELSQFLQDINAMGAGIETTRGGMPGMPPGMPAPPVR